MASLGPAMTVWLGPLKLTAKTPSSSPINSAVISGDSTVLTPASHGSATGLLPFNPFTERPVRGVNWTYGPAFGEPTGTGDYQQPRTFSCSVGLRF